MDFFCVCFQHLKETGESHSCGLDVLSTEIRVGKSWRKYLLKEASGLLCWVCCCHAILISRCLILFLFFFKKKVIILSFLYQPIQTDTVMWKRSYVLLTEKYYEVLKWGIFNLRWTTTHEVLNWWLYEETAWKKNKKSKTEETFAASTGNERSSNISFC